MDRRDFIGSGLGWAAGTAFGADAFAAPPPATVADDHIRRLVAGGAADVMVPEGHHVLTRAFELPPGKRLVGKGQCILSFRPARRGYSHMIRLRDDAAVENIEFRGGVTRGLLGDAPDASLFGIMIYGSGNHVAGCRFLDFGATDLSFRSKGGNGGAVAIEGGVAARGGGSCHANLIENCVSTSPLAGFHIRLKTPFQGEGDAGAQVTRNIVRNLVLYGGNKNGIELAGPRTTGNRITGCTLINPLGQGGMEADFGASSNLFEKCVIRIKGDAVPLKTFDAFSQRTFTGKDGSLHIPHGNEFVDCRLELEDARLKHDVRAFVCFGAGSDCRFIRPRILVKSASQPSRRIIGLYEESRFRRISGTQLTQPDFAGVTMQRKAI